MSSDFCLECGDYFSVQVWHCPVCGGHYDMENTDCGNCHLSVAPGHNNNSKESSNG